jgi:hypothetical protein
MYIAGWRHDEFISRPTLPLRRAKKTASRASGRGEHDNHCRHQLSTSQSSPKWPQRGVDQALQCCPRSDVVQTRCPSNRGAKPLSLPPPRAQRPLARAMHRRRPVRAGPLRAGLRPGAPGARGAAMRRPTRAWVWRAARAGRHPTRARAAAAAAAQRRIPNVGTSFRGGAPPARSETAWPRPVRLRDRPPQTWVARRSQQAQTRAQGGRATRARRCASQVCVGVGWFET